MLIFISDLHFIDEETGHHNIPLRAFEGAFKDIKNYCGTPSEIKLVLLGDIFDLLRTTAWFRVPEAERPWGDMANNGHAIEKHALLIMKEIVKKNAKTLHFLNKDIEDIFEQKVEKIYIPGNHDRLCNMFDSLRIKVRETLGIDGDAEPFSHCYDDLKYGNLYGVFARHGHEYDSFNYEGSESFTDSEYLLTPIGDLIATEIVARLPYTIMKNVGDAVSEDKKDELERNLKEVDNVRPLSAVLKWIFYQVSEKPSLYKVLEKSLAEIADNFERINYYQVWRKRHRTPFRLDTADMLHLILYIFKSFNVSHAERIFNWAGKFSRFLPTGFSDSMLIDGAKEFFKDPAKYRNMVMGHTHNPLATPIRVDGDGFEQIYVNTGTWRKRYVRGIAGGFISLKYVTYIVFYNKEENPVQSFEIWSGILKEEV